MSLPRIAALGILVASSIGTVGCEEEEPLPEGITFFNRRWVDSKAERSVGKEYVRSFSADRWRKEDRNPGPGQGPMTIQRNSEFEHHLRSGHFYVKGPGEIEFVDHLGEVRLQVSYRMYACDEGRFDLCAHVDGLDGKRTFYSVRNQTHPGPPPDDAKQY